VTLADSAEHTYYQIECLIADWIFIGIVFFDIYNLRFVQVYEFCSKFIHDLATLY